MIQRTLYKDAIMSRRIFTLTVAFALLPLGISILATILLTSSLTRGPLPGYVEGLRNFLVYYATFSIGFVLASWRGLIPFTKSNPGGGKRNHVALIHLLGLIAFSLPAVGGLILFFVGAHIAELYGFGGVSLISILIWSWFFRRRVSA